MSEIRLKNIKCPKCGEWVMPPSTKRINITEGTRGLVVPCFSCGEKMSFRFVEREECEEHD